MSEFEPESGWYSSQADGWYSSAANCAAAAATPERTPAKRRRKTGLIVGVSSISVIVILSLLFICVIMPLKELTEGGFPGLESPASGEFDYDTWANLSPDDYDDYRDFFANYFTDTDIPVTANTSNIEHYEGANFTLTLSSAEGAEELSFSEIYKKCIDSVVGVSAEQNGKNGYCWGSGVIMSEDGYILTNDHIIVNADRAYILTSDGERHPAKVVGEDPRADLAVLKIEANGLQPARFGVSDELSVGDGVCAIGNPLNEEFSGTFTNGIISAMNRDVANEDGIIQTLLQTNTAINEGSSGGPLINMYGQVVGLTNMKMTGSYFSVTVEGMSFAIPTSDSLETINVLLRSGTPQHPGIGITIGIVPENAMEAYDLPEGLYISAVSEESDCYQKGIQVGDVLTAVNGISVRTTADVSAIKDGLSVGDTLTLTIYREGETRDYVIELYDMNKLY